MTPDATDDDLRRRYQADAAGEGEHVDDPTWERLACGEIGPAERVRVSEHITSCAVCGAIYRALTDLREEAQRFDPGAPAADSREFRAWLASWRQALAVAAALTLVVVALTYRREPSSTTRGGDAAAGVSTTAPAGTAAANPALEFRWAPVAGADHYRLTLHAADGLPLWTSPNLSETKAGWPATVAAAPGTYFWQVFALGDGHELADSPLVRLTLTRP